MPTYIFNKSLYCLQFYHSEVFFLFIDHGLGKEGFNEFVDVFVGLVVANCGVFEIKAHVASPLVPQLQRVLALLLQTPEHQQRLLGPPEEL